MSLCRGPNSMVLPSKSISTLIMQADRNAKELGRQGSTMASIFCLSGKTRFAGFKMSLWGKYVTMLRGEFDGAAERIH
jgi:hypothetical protein